MMKRPWKTAVKVAVQDITGAASTRKKPPAKPLERTGGYWPDDDLAEIEAPRPPTWIKRKKNWLERRR